jgi:uncharacterized protein YqhQ
LPHSKQLNIKSNESNLFFLAKHKYFVYKLTFRVKSWFQTDKILENNSKYARNIMDDKHCNRCHNKHDCQSIYQTLGRSNAPNVTLHVILAFIMPVLVFVFSLAVSDRILETIFENSLFKTVVGAVLALIVTFIYLFIVRLFYSKPSNKKN